MLQSFIPNLNMYRLVIFKIDHPKINKERLKEMKMTLNDCCVYIEFNKFGFCFRKIITAGQQCFGRSFFEIIKQR